MKKISSRYGGGGEDHSHCLSDDAGDHTREFPASPAADQEREGQCDLHEGGQAVRDRDPGGDQQPHQGQVSHHYL